MVARHKGAFFAERGMDGAWIDYNRSINGELRIVPEGDAQLALASDYKRMVDDGLLLDDVEPFDVLMVRCRAIESLANNSPARET
jgi:hypothetical protein